MIEINFFDILDIAVEHRLDLKKTIAVSEVYIYELKPSIS